MILVTGATGNTGGALLPELLAGEAEMRAGMDRQAWPAFMAGALVELGRAGTNANAPFCTTAARDVTGKDARTYAAWLADQLGAFA
jgi:uncharacterized protein YbjT (DUF2867 family)